MSKRIFEADISDDLRMADAKGEPGGKRGLLFGSDGLRKQAVFHEVSEEELAERYRSRFEEEHRRELSPEEKEFYGRLAELGFNLVCGAIGRGVELAKPRVEQVMKEKVIPRGEAALRSLRKKHDAKRKGEERVSKGIIDGLLPPIKACEIARSNIDGLASNEPDASRASDDVKPVRLDSAGARDRTTQADLRPISQDEARERIARIMLLAQAAADEYRELSRCRLEDGEQVEPSLYGLVESQALGGLTHLVFDGETRFLPPESTDAFLNLLYSDEISDRLIEIPLEGRDGSKRLNGPGHGE